MSSKIGLQPTSGVAPAPLSCSICFELVTSGNDRSTAKLMCGHQFHLDCIGSAFNAKGMMQCPNCRHTENGQWLYANGHRQREDVMEDVGNEEEYRVFAEVSELLFPHDLMNLGNLWCPVQSSYTQLSLSVGDTNHPSAAHADVVFNIYMDDPMGRPESSQACPFLQAHGLNFPRHAPLGEGNMGVAAVPLNPHHGAAAQNLSSGQNFRGQWPRPSTPSAMPNGGDGMAFPGRPRPVHHDHQLAGTSFSSHRRENAVSWVSLPTQSSIRHPPYYPEGQVFSGPFDWEFTRSGIRDTTWETGPRDNVPLPQWRREGSSALQHFPPDFETRSWAPLPLSGLHGSHGPENTIRTGSRTSEGHLASQYQGHFQGYPPSFFSESRMDTSSFQSPSFNSPR